MPHNTDLIEFISKKLNETYPPESFRYLIERPLQGFNVKFFPDIQVLDYHDHLLCVVEIGYTRPEKIKFYYENKITDIRWYSKEGELVNATWETKIKIIKHIPEDCTVWDSCSFGPDDVGFLNRSETCEECYLEELQELINIYCDDYCFLKNQNIYGECLNCLEYLSEDIQNKIFEDLCEFEVNMDQCGVIYTNGKKVAVIVFCDHCGGSRIVYNLEDSCPFIFGGEYLESYEDFERLVSKLHRKHRERGVFRDRHDKAIEIPSPVKRDMSFSKVCLDAAEIFGVDLDYSLLPNFIDRQKAVD